MGSVNIKPSRITDNGKEVAELLTRALAGKIGVDDEGWLWLCSVKIGRVKMENGKPKKNGSKEMELA